MEDGMETGLDRLAVEQVRGKRVGLITNPTGIDRRFRRTVAVLTERGAAVVALFGPEHGYHGVEQAGVPVSGGERDLATGLPIYSLYQIMDGDAHLFGPPPGSMDGLDLLVFDIQDVGARYYTYPSTLGIFMEQVSLPLLVIDRTNPIGGAIVEGPLLDPAVRSFVGRYPVPVRHGLTIGELAMLINVQFLGGKAALTVAPMAGWRREILWHETTLPWVPPSPNIPTPETALLYPGTCLFEGTNLSLGRGTTRPFEVIGAPWIAPEPLSAALRALALPGLAFRPTYFKPAFDRFAGETCGGVQIHLTEEGRRRGAPEIVRSGVRMVAAVAHRYPEEFAWLPHHFDRLIGSDRPRTTITERGDDPAALPTLFAGWDADEEAFLRHARASCATHNTRSRQTAYPSANHRRTPWITCHCSRAPARAGVVSARKLLHNREGFQKDWGRGRDCHELCKASITDTCETNDAPARPSRIGCRRERRGRTRGVRREQRHRYAETGSNHGCRRDDCSECRHICARRDIRPRRDDGGRFGRRSHPARRLRRHRNNGGEFGHNEHDCGESRCRAS